jgi:hypothetical protein
LSIQKDAIPGVANFLAAAWLRSAKLPHRNIGPSVDYLESFAIFSGHYAGTMNKISSRVTSRKAVLAFARASAAKPHAGGGLALLMEH